MKKIILSFAFLAVNSLIFFSCQPEDIISVGTNGSNGSSSSSSSSSSSVSGLTNGQTITGAGAIVSRIADLEAFQSITVSTVVTTEVVLGSGFKIEVSDYENLREFIKFEVINNELFIKIEGPENTGISNTKAKAIVTIPADQLKNLTCSGTANITLKDTFNGLANVSVSGTASISSTAYSSTTSLTAVASGAGRIDLLNILAENVTVTSSGTSNSKFAVSQTLNATLRGVSTVSYKGNPVVTKRVSFNSKLIKL